MLRKSYTKLSKLIRKQAATIFRKKDTNLDDQNDEFKSDINSGEIDTMIGGFVSLQGNWPNHTNRR